MPAEWIQEACKSSIPLPLPAKIEQVARDPQMKELSQQLSILSSKQQAFQAALEKAT